MKHINRRSFLSQTSKVACASFVLSQIPKALLAGAFANNMPLGFQSWAVKDKLSQDFAGTLKTMKNLGYSMIEMCSPKGYEKIGFGAFAKMKPLEIKQVINDAGLTCPSCHFVFNELTTDVDESIEFAKEIGLTQMICSTFWLSKTATIDDYNTAADKFNKSAEKIKAAGIQAGFHNHDFEFAKINGELIYDALLKRFDPELIKLQFQTQVITLGYKASDYFTKYPGRFISAHLSDWTADKKEVPIGKGVIDWETFFATAKTGGVQNMFVEMAVDTFKDSAAYIHKM